MPVSWRPARRFLTKVLQFLSAVGSPYRTWPVRAFGPCTGQTRRPSPDPLPASWRPRRSAGTSGLFPGSAWAFLVVPENQRVGGSLTPFIFLAHPLGSFGRLAKAGEKAREAGTRMGKLTT